MLIWTAVWILMWIMGIASIPMLILSIINKKASVAKGLIFLGIYLPIFVIAMIYLFTTVLKYKKNNKQE